MDAKSFEENTNPSKLKQKIDNLENKGRNKFRNTIKNKGGDNKNV